MKCIPQMILIALVLRATTALAAPAIEFNRDVRPILSANCFKCHGIDDGARKSKLRLDVREVATAPAKSGKVAIVPGKPDASELVRRVFSPDPDEVMPPASTKVVLSATQKSLLKQWVAAGAKYEVHWAFVAPRQAPLPEVKDATWAANPIDRFVLAKLRSEGLSPSPEADRFTLIRRVSLDLVGIPPTPAEADAFAKDPSRDAYDKLVDRLLASPHYGERWARRWLDLARYADTNGFEKDRPRPIWPYRDWVINALNADMPFDQFTIKQLAGDMLPKPTSDDRVATGFHRNTMLNEEGGIDPLEYRFRAAVDRTNTTGTTWLGLTVGCAQCHTHKFDPIRQSEYYSLMAFLNNADEPEMTVPDAGIAEKRAQVETKIAKLTRELPDKWSTRGATTGKASASQAATTQSASDEPDSPREKARRAFADWEKRESARAVKWTVLRPAEMSAKSPFLTLQPDGSILAGGDIIKSDTYELKFRDVPKGITAVRLEVLPDASLPSNGPGMVYYEGTHGDFFLSEISLLADGAAHKFAKAAQSFADGKFVAEKAIDGDPQTGWSVKGAQGRANLAVFALAEPVGETRELTLRMLFERYFAAPLGHFRISVTTDQKAADPVPLPAEVESALAIAADARTAGQRDSLFDYFLSVAPELAPARKEIDRLGDSIPKEPTTLVLSERPAGHARPTYVHHRGEFLQTAEEVKPAIPSFLPPLPAGAPANRLTFARWLVSPENPLTARVTVNRQWQAFFGRGIVGTLQDFGYQGDLPTHPELLDWLAVEFMKEGWSLKKLDRLIVTSATYKQSSLVTPDRLEKDPQDLLLSRAPRFRLEAELIRDAALADASLLSPKIGGPSVFPPQPASVTTEGTYGALAWKASTGEDRYRRSLYTFSKRTAPFAMYNTFDAPTGEECLARREVSNSPLQALTLLNDTMFIEAAQAMGRNVAAGDGSDEAKATSVFRECLTRAPDSEELQALVEFAQKQRDRLKSGELDAQKLAGEGKGDAVERATWTMVARAVMNFDEAVTRP
ncbi:MAG TPA: PSD1 and planctomycete cytochrome C domain-containing protein [Tepidisphaeraceae bacterium]|nr:PSD1 and planctomycete cytochrome C domain-containing protein [Tepidisphaeraceae bacterium]